MKIIKNLIEERKWKKKYNALKVIFDVEEEDKQSLKDEVDYLREKIKKIRREIRQERDELRGRNTKQKLPNDKGSTTTSRNRVSVSKQNN